MNYFSVFHCFQYNAMPTALKRAIGVSTYETGKVLSELQAELPTVEQLQQMLDPAGLEHEDANK